MPGTAPSTAPSEEQRSSSHQLRNTSFAPWIWEKREPTLVSPEMARRAMARSHISGRAKMPRTNGTIGSPSHR